MNIAFLSSECQPYSKTGGLADVSGALPRALASKGLNVKVFTPLYQSISTIDFDLVFRQDLYQIPVTLGSGEFRFNVWSVSDGESHEVFFIDCPHFFHRSYFYSFDEDEDQRFALFQHASIKILQYLGWKPDVVHCNDWQTGLVPALLQSVYSWDKLFQSARTLFTIHNIAYQGRFPRPSVEMAGLSYYDFTPGGPLEMWGDLSFMKAGISYADAVSTVSPGYADEIMTPAYGEGLDGLLRERQDRVFGIVNGIDTDIWNPATDTYISQNYSAESIDDKVVNKKGLLEEFGLSFGAETPVIGMISRLTPQKGLDLLQPILGSLVEQQSIQFVLLGSGEDRYQDFLRWAVAAYPYSVANFIGYSEELSHKIEAGADMFLMPSAYEPCGLNQMYSLAYGTVPVVRKTGGLADTVKDYHECPGEGTGFSFYDFTPHALYTSIHRALDVYRKPDEWREVQLRGMAEDFSWEASAEQYISLYDEILSF